MDLERREYTGPPLDVGDLDLDPIVQFGRWYEAARAAVRPLGAQGTEAHVMTLATADAAGRPSARIVLLRGFDAEGFVFYGDQGGRKGRELEVNPHAALVFHWPLLARQVRIEGAVSPLPRGTSDAYFAGRPRGSQLSAAASEQSATVESRAALEARRAALAAEVGDGPVPVPARWGGYRVRPDRLEFWQGRADRLHDRLCYVRRGAAWHLERLQP